MSEGVTRALGAPPANQPRLELYKGCTWSQSLVRLLSPHCVTKWRKQFVLNEVVWQTRHDCYSQDQKQTEPERAISINLKLHAVVMSLGKEIEDKLCVEDEVEDEVKQDASPDEKVIYPRPVLRQKWDLDVNNHHQNGCDHSAKERHGRGFQTIIDYFILESTERQKEDG